MKIKLILGVLCGVSLGGCAFGGNVVSNIGVSKISHKEVYLAKLGFCNVYVSEDDITKFTGNDRTLPPEVRAAQKQAALNEWEQEKVKAKAKVQGKSYYFEVPAIFNHYQEAQQRMVFIPTVAKSSSASYVYELATAIPDRVFFNTAQDRRIAPYPKGADYKWVYEHYYNFEVKSGPAYHLTSRLSGNTVYELGKYEFIRGKSSFNDRTLGVIVDTSNWVSASNSPIFLDNDRHFLNTKNIDFVEAFGVYPDTGSVMLRMRFIYEITGCEGNNPKGTLKEVVIYPVSSDPNPFKVTKPLATITI